MRALNHLLIVAVVSVGDPVGALAAQRAPVAGAAIRTSGPLADSLRAFAFDMVAKLRALDVEGAIRLYDDTTHFVHVDNGVIFPWRELSSRMRSFFRTAQSNPLEVIGEPGVTLIDRNTAAVYVSHRSGATAEGPAHEGVWTGVLRRGPNGWRVVHSHSSDKRP